MRRLLPAFLAVLSALGCARPAEKPPIILISIDTLRADRLPMYGYRGVATPALDALRRDSVLFENAWSHSPLTLPSHASILTGRLPAKHGVRDNTGFRLSAEVPTLPALLREHGYATGAAVSAFILRGTTGVDAGFEAYDDDLVRLRGETSLGHIQRPGDETVAVAKEWIAAHADRPFFYFLHLYEPHSPYDAPEPFASRYPSSYDGEVAQSDAIVGRFLAFLKEKGIYDRAMIVLVSDHGEGLGDHGEEEHGIFLYREAIKVPLLVKMPGQRFGEAGIRAPAGLVDVAPTVLRAAGVAPPAGMDGLALFDGTRLADLPERALYSETFYPRFHFGWSDLHSLVYGDEHFIQAPRSELYDLGRDPGETRNVLPERRRRFVFFRRALAGFVSEPGAPSPISSEEAEKLAALGYIGSAASVSGPRPDPKEKIQTFRELQRAFGLARQRKDAEALAAFDRLLETEPDMVDLWDVRSKTLIRLGRMKEGIASAKEALRRNPAATHIAADLADALLLEGEVEEARLHAELALRTDPAKAHAILARVALARKDLAAAEREARAAVAAGGDEKAALYMLATVQQRKGDWAGVLETTGRLMTPPLVRGVNAMRGDALARLGRDTEAEAALRAELKAFPDSAEAARRLVIVLVAQNRNEEATAVIRAFAAASPTPATYRTIAETLAVVGDDAGARYWSAREKGRS